MPARNRSLSVLFRRSGPMSLSLPSGRQRVSLLIQPISEIYVSFRVHILFNNNRRCRFADYVTLSTLPVPIIASNSAIYNDLNEETALTDCGPARAVRTFMTATLSVAPATWTFRGRQTTG